ncbi:hypothetical protein E2562_007686 [Oryza meyeriana var. granulata]|uniref:Uncharacterized protein n=1 Tax=Oryza meyeriana var. granulata TaxID=110450 RepID=A0A6G1EIP1_9ORYZ|nr:hypothetical protein E2562_007686 [Oryza meyeriana var. granulata]
MRPLGFPKSTGAGDGDGGLEAAVLVALDGRGGAGHLARVPRIHDAAGHHVRVTPVRHGPPSMRRSSGGSPSSSPRTNSSRSSDLKRLRRLHGHPGQGFKSAHEGVIYELVRHIWPPSLKRGGATHPAPRSMPTPRGRGGRRVRQRTA